METANTNEEALGRTDDNAVRTVAPEKGERPEGTRGTDSRADAKSALRRRIVFALKFTISLGLIAFIVSRANLDAVLAALAGVRIEWLLVAGLLQVVGPMLITLRWGGLLAAHDVRPTFAYLYRSMLVSVFFRQFLPSTIGGDAIRAHDAWKAQASVGTALTSLLVDRLLGLLVLTLFVAIAAVLSADIGDRIPGLFVWLGVGLAGLVAVMSAMFVPNRGLSRLVEAVSAVLPNAIGGRIRKLFDALLAYRGEYAVLGRAFLISILVQVNVVTFYFALSMALDLGLAYRDFFVVVPIATFVMMAPVSINGIGLREGVFIFLLGRFGVGEDQALAFAWLEYGTFLLFALLGGVVYALRKG